MAQPLMLRNSPATLRIVDSYFGRPANIRYADVLAASELLSSVPFCRSYRVKNTQFRRYRRAGRCLHRAPATWPECATCRRRWGPASHAFPSESGASPAKCLHAVGIGLGIRCRSVMSRLSEAASLSRWTLPLLGERLRDSLCYRGCAREGHVRHYCHRQSAFGEREKGRHFFNPKMAIVASGLDLVTRQCHGLQVPA